MALPTVEQQAMDWIEMTRTPVAECSNELFDAGFELNIHAHDNPAFALDVILKIVEALDEKDLASGEGDAQELAFNLAAGPLESLLSQHGEGLIERVEQIAKEAPKFALVLTGVWQNDMSDTVWKRINNLVGR